MKPRSNLLLAVLIASTLLSLSVTTAQARRIWTSFPQYRAIWPLLRFEFIELATVECPVTLEGSFHSQSLSKVSGSLVGYVTSARISGTRAACLNTGTARFNTETLPWHVRYASFTGSLPRISTLTLQAIHMDINADPEGLTPNCNIITTETMPGVGILEELTTGAGGQIVRSLRADETRTITIVFEEFCAIVGPGISLRGKAEFFAQGGTTRMTLRLIP